MQGSGDSSTQLGNINTILKTGHDYSYTPIATIFTSSFSLITGIDYFYSFTGLVFLTQTLFIFILFLFGRLIMKSTRFAFIIASLVPISRWGKIDFSIAWASSLVIFAILSYLIFKEGNSKSLNIIISIFLMTSILSHPMTGLISLSFFIIITLVYSLIKNKSLVLISRDFYKNSNIIFFGIFFFVLWNIIILFINFKIMITPLINMMLTGSNRINIGAISDFTIYGLTLIDLFILILKEYFNWIILGIFSLISIIILIYRRHKLDRIDQIILCLSSWNFIIVLGFTSLYSIFSSSGVDFAPPRLMAYSLFFSPIIVIYSFKRFNLLRQKTLPINKKFINFLIILIVFFCTTISIFNAYNSPEYDMVRSSEAMPSLIYGINWIMKNNNGNFHFNIYGDSRLMDAFKTFDTLHSKENLNYITTSISNITSSLWEDQSIKDNNVTTFLFSITEGRILRNLNIPIPKDLSFSYSNYLKIRSTSFINFIYNSDRYYLYQVTLYK